MPRGGSKKGEHRGQAKREAKKRGVKPGTVNNPAGKTKGTLNRKTMERLAAVSSEIGVAELNGLMPKAMLLEISRIFYKMAMDEMELMAQGVSEARGEFERHIVLAGDHAYKAANYYHPRLQALAIAGGSDASPGDVLRGLLEEIDGETRLERQQVRQIEHEPTPEAVALKDVMEG